MSGKGFGERQPTKIDKLIESAVRYCHKRNPESLDQIFDNLPVKSNQQVVTGILAAFQKDIDTLCWFCGYMASEINRTDDPIKDLQIVAHVMTIAKTHKISNQSALELYFQKRKLELEQEKKENTNLYDSLKSSLSPQNWESVMNYVRHHPTDEELSQAYYQAKQEGKLKPAKLLVGGDFYFRNSDFVGNKYFPPGITVEAEVYDDTIGHVWLSPMEVRICFYK